MLSGEEGPQGHPDLRAMDFFWGMSRDKMFKHKTKIQKVTSWMLLLLLTTTGFMLE
jgi:hypothetical protein